MLFQVTNFNAQKVGSKKPCVDNRATQEVCIDIETNGYRGYYQLRDSDYKPIPDYDTFFKDSNPFKLKAGKYRIIIGNNTNSILFDLSESGTITSENSVALDTSINKKIKFNTVQIKINPDRFDGFYYLSIFRQMELFYDKGQWCPFTKNSSNIPPKIETEITKVCPPNRTSQFPVYLVPSLVYFIEAQGLGYSATTFKVDDQGKVTDITSPKSLIFEKNELKFLTREIKISTTNYSGIFRLGQNLYQWKKISPSQPMYYEVVVNSNTFFQLDGSNNAQPLVVYLNSSGVSEVIPSTAFFELPEQNQTNTNEKVYQFRFCLVGKTYNDILCK